MNALEYGKYYHIYNRGNNREDLFKTDENHHYFLQLYEKYIGLIADTCAWVLMKNHFHFLVRIKEEKEMDDLPPIDPSRSDDPGRSIKFLDPSRSQVVDLEGSEGPSRVGSDPIIDPSRSGDAGRSTEMKTFQGPNDLEESDSFPIDPSRSCDAGRSTEMKTFHGPQDMEGSDLRKRKKPLPSHQFAHLFNAYTKYYNKTFHRTGSLFEKNFKRIEITSEQYFRQLVVYIHTNPFHHKIMDDYIGYPWSSYQSLISTQQSIIKREQVMEWFGDRENLIEMHNKKMEDDNLNGFCLE